MGFRWQLVSEGSFRPSLDTDGAEPNRADLEGMWVTAVACERPSDQLSDNRHRRRWTPEDNAGGLPRAGVLRGW